MAPSVEKGPKKAKGMSKKGKKGWRKNVDIEKVEEYLEDQRLEERLGGSFVNRPDEELFTIDKEITDVKDEEILPRRRKRAEKPLRCFQHLEIKGGVSDPKKGRNKRKTPQERKNPKLVEKEQELAKNGIIKAKAKMQKEHRELEKLKKTANQLERTTRRRTKFDFDLWGDENGEVKQVKNNDWLDETTKNHTLKNTGKLTRKLPHDLLDKPSDLKPVEAPHAGMSYNPSLKDHQDLLWKAAIIEMNKEKAERKIEYHTDRMFPTADQMPTKEAWIKEMSQGIAKLEGNTEENEEEEVEETDEETDDENKSFKPKTKKDRNREKREKYAENRKKSELENKKKAQDIFLIKSMKKQMKVSDQVSALKGKIKEAKKKEKRLLPATLSGTKFEENEIPLKLSEELTGNLRTMKPEGNLLEDRFKSLQKRNVIETRNKRNAPQRKGKRTKKKVEKRAYKMGFTWEKK